jgi:uncharacterized membrane protein YdbT with pleckstrin-like domain
MLNREKAIPHSKTHLEKLHSHSGKELDFFPGQRSNEKVKMCIRSNWLREAGIFIRFIVLAVISPMFLVIFLNFFSFGEINWSFIYLALILYLMGVWLYTFIEFIKNDLTVIMVTNERIVDFTQTSLFFRKISEIGLSRIQEVTGYTTGFISNFLNVGKLEIQTAGTDIPLMMRYVKSPNLTSRKILDIQRFASLQRRSSDFAEKREGDNIQPREGEGFTPEDLREMRGKKPKQPSPPKRDWSKDDVS